MKNLSFLLAFSLSALAANAFPGDTIKVQTFTFGSKQDAKFKFPSDTIRFEKILMNYKLKCNPAQSPACGEWDYLTYTYLFDHTGKMDSTLNYAPSYTIDGASPDSVEYMEQPSWRYFPVFEKFTVRTAVLSFDSAKVGNGLVSSPHPFGDKQSNRSQFLWRAPELSAAGLVSGNITGLRFNAGSAGSLLKDLTVRIKQVSRDSLHPSTYENSGLTTVYSRNTTLSSGWNTLSFTVPFSWNGTDNLLIDISFSGIPGGTVSSVLSESTAWSSSLVFSQDDRAAYFEGADYIDVPSAAFADIDSFITIQFWQYGNPVYQPQDQSLFEGLDAWGNRVVNAHVPWSNSNVYWDAGNMGGSYDRINKAAPASSFEGRWNHWAFTKNCKTGRMFIYLNGKLFHTGFSKLRTMSGIKKFRIGSAGNGTSNYDGYIDEFSVWKAELDSSSIRKLMYSPVDNSHPFRSKLSVYYRFNEEDLGSAADSSGNQYHGILAGPPQKIPVKAGEVFMGFRKTFTRPNVILEEGVYSSYTDSLLRIDSVHKAPVQVVFYKDPVQVTLPTDTVTVWPSYYSRYTYDSQGKATDSLKVTPDSVLYLVKTPYYTTFEIIDRYELGRLITPYGNGLDLGPGFTWVYDVSDYRTLLHDSVHLAAGNWQELLDLSFDFIKGVPPRDPIRVENLWVGQPAYGTSTSIETFLSPRTVKIGADAINTRLKVRTTGHGFGGSLNCAEFCAKNHSFWINGVQRYNKVVWRDNCGLNPLYPQGGTWIYNRSNWCPGAEVETYDLELTPYVTPGATASVDYNVDSYTWNGQGSLPYYAIETQLVSYSAPNFTLDAALEDIKAPSRNDMYKRMNPICGKPLVRIKNTGSSTLTSLTITYGIVGGTPSSYTWTGSLPFLKSADVELPSFSVSSAGTDKRFYAMVGAPNGGTDQYPDNNRMETPYVAPARFSGYIVFELKTNNYGYETSYEVKDAGGSLLLSRSGLGNNITYRDTLNLGDGCYEFRLKDTGEDGLSWWANTAQGNGYMRIKRASDGSMIRAYNPDFGAEIFEQFTVDNTVSISSPEFTERVNIYPNPSTGIVNVDITFPGPLPAEIKITNLLGETVCLAKKEQNTVHELELNLSGNPAGIYFVEVRTPERSILRKIILEKQGM